MTMLQQPQEPARPGNLRARLLAPPPQLPVRSGHQAVSAQLSGLVSDGVVARSRGQHDLHQAIRIRENLTIRRGSTHIFFSRFFSRDEREGIGGLPGTALEHEHPGGVAPRRRRGWG